MAVIIKVCGKKTPFVYAKRRNRHKTFHHDVTEVPMGGDIEEGGAPGLQVHPTTVEASVPLGKKVRVGMGGKRDKKSKRRSRSKSKDKKSTSSEAHGNHRSDYFRRQPGKTDENIAKATLLAANLSQLLVTLPPERLGHDSELVTSENAKISQSNNSKATTHSNSVDKNQISSQDSPSKSDVAVLIPNHGKNASILPQNKDIRQQSKTNDSENNQKRRKANDVEKKNEKGKLNPADMLSKSFEKLDMINHRRERAKRARAKRHGVQSDDDSETHIIDDKDAERKSRHKDHSRQRRVRSKDAKETDGKDAGKEVTIAKVGRFKFSLELNKKFEEESKQKEQRKHRSKHRSKSHSSRTPSKSGRKRRREKQAMESKEQGIDKNSDNDENNMKAQQSNKKYDHKENQSNPNSSAPQRKSKSTVQAPVGINKVPSVIVSKQRNHDRPLLLNENRRQRKSVPAMALNVKSEKGKKNDSDSSDHEYEVIDICRENAEKFARSISHPAESIQEAPKIELLRGTTVCDPLAMKTNENKGAALRIRKHSAPQNQKKFNADGSQAMRQSEARAAKVRRAETTKEKASTRLGVSRKESLLLLPDNALARPSENSTANRLKPITSSSKNDKNSVPTFDNHAYDKSPEPISDNHKKKLTKNRSGLLLHEDSEEKESNDAIDVGSEMDNLGEKLSRLSSLTLSSLNSTFHLNKRRAEYSTKKKYHSVDSESPTHHYDNVPLPKPLSKSEEDGSSTDASSGSSTSLTSPSTSSDSKRMSPQTQVHSLSEETNSLTGESTIKSIDENLVNPPSSFRDKSSIDKSNTKKSQSYKNQDKDGTISSSSEYSTSSEEDSSTNDSDTDSSSEEEDRTNNGMKKANGATKQVRSLSSKPSMKEMGGISRAQILENVKNESIEDEDEDEDFRGIDQGQREYNQQPPDLSLAFIGCDNEEQIDQNIRSTHLPPPVLPTQTTGNVNPRAAPNNVRRKTSSLSQRYGVVRRSTSRGSTAIEENKEASGNISANNKSLELDDIQLDEYINNSNQGGNPYTAKPQSPKFLRPQNKVILGDSTDNVSILTDGML